MKEIGLQKRSVSLILCISNIFFLLFGLNNYSLAKSNTLVQGDTLQIDEILSDDDIAYLLDCAFEGKDPDAIADGFEDFSLEDSLMLDVLLQNPSPECIAQVAKAIQSFVFVIFDCIIDQDSRQCAISITNLITDIILAKSICQEEPSPEE